MRSRQSRALAIVTGLGSAGNVGYHGVIGAISPERASRPCRVLGSAVYSVPRVPGNVMQITTPLLAALAKLISGASVRWVDCEPDTCQRVYFANHTSHLDALLLWASLPAEIRCLTRPVAAKDYWERGAIRRYIARQFNALLIDRKEIKVHRSPVQIMLNEIGDTHSLIVFPEGGRNTSTELGEFKSGLFHLSKKKPELELIPVYIENLNRVLPRGEFLPVPLLSHLTYGPPMWLETGETKVEFLNRARGAVLRLKEL